MGGLVRPFHERRSRIRGSIRIYVRPPTLDGRSPSRYMATTADGLLSCLLPSSGSLVPLYWPVSSWDDICRSSSSISTLTVSPSSNGNDEPLTTADGILTYSVLASPLLKIWPSACKAILWLYKRFPINLCSQHSIFFLVRQRIFHNDVLCYSAWRSYGSVYRDPQ